DGAPQRLAHDALPHHAVIQPITEGRAMEGAPHEVIKVAISEHGALWIPLPEDRESYRIPLFEIADVALELLSPECLCEIPLGKRRLPTAQVLCVLFGEAQMLLRHARRRQRQQQPLAVKHGNRPLRTDRFTGRHGARTWP